MARLPFSQHSEELAPCSGKIRAIQFIVPGIARHVHAAPADKH
jgi:hypothetical protein